MTPPPKKKVQIYNAVAKHCRDSCFIATILRDKKRRLTLSTYNEMSLNIHSPKDPKLKLNCCNDSSNSTKNEWIGCWFFFNLSEKNFVVECWWLKYDRKKCQNSISFLFVFCICLKNSSVFYNWWVWSGCKINSL